MRRLPLIFSLVLTCAPFAFAQEAGKAAKETSTRKENPEAQAEATRLLNQRRAQVRSLLISLASEARSFNDQTLRARVQARVADAIWDVDAEQGRGLFRKAWEAAEIGDEESRRRMREDIQQQKAKSGGYIISNPLNLRGEVLRLAAKRDRPLGEELLEKMKEQKQSEAIEDLEDTKRNPMASNAAVRQRLTLAQQLLDAGDTERALQFAEAALTTVTMDGVNFLSFLREKDAPPADRRYAAMLNIAEGNVQADANTVSLLSSYIFTPHLFVTFDPNGGTSSSSMSRNQAAVNVGPELQAAFLRTAATILMRPLPPPEQDQTTSGRFGKYLVIKRLLPLFTQYASKETTDSMKAQLDVLANAVPEEARNRDDEWLKRGISPETKSEEREQKLNDQIERAKTADERDQLYIQLINLIVQKGELRARDLVDKIEDTEVRKQLRGYVDASLASRLIGMKDIEHALEISRIGELTHLQRVWVLTQSAALLAATDREKALALLDQADEEARRIEGVDADRPRSLMAVASGRISLDLATGWDATLEAVRAANSAEGYSGEDGRIVISYQGKGMRSIHTSGVEEFNVAKAFTALAKADYERAVQMATGFRADAPRASATIAIARAILETKKTPAKTTKVAAKTN